MEEWHTATCFNIDRVSYEYLSYTLEQDFFC